MQKQVNEIMSRKLFTLPFEVGLVEVYRAMQERKIRHIPITDTSHKIIGILSDRDLQRAMQVQISSGGHFEVEAVFHPHAKAKDFMSFPVATVSIQESVREVAIRMLNQKISCVLVADPVGHPLGIITTDDMLKCLISLLDKGPGRISLALDQIISDSSSAGYWI